MNPMDPTDLPQSVIDMMSPEQRKEFGLFSTGEEIERSEAAVKKLEEKDEREIQNAVEAYLVQLGYERRSSEAIKRGEPKSGYFIHLHATKRNPIICDLLILSNSREYLELELKTTTGSITSEQKCLIDQGASLARSAEEACGIIKAWHEKQSFDTATV